jgi:V-type H+-transporting ATPase subunit E
MNGLDNDAFELKRMMRQEAHEKAFEVRVMGQRLFEKEKTKIVKEEIATLHSETEKKKQNLQMELNIQRSQKINSTRLAKMSEREKCIQEIKEELKQKLVSEVANTNNPEYKKFLKELIIQGMIKLLEEEVVIRARKEDLPYIKSITAECETTFKRYMKEQTGRDYSSKIKLDEQNYMTEAQGAKYGGVVLASTDLKIVCINTMISRLNQCFEELLPQIRTTLFPKN